MNYWPNRRRLFSVVSEILGFLNLIIVFSFIFHSSLRSNYSSTLRAIFREGFYEFFIITNCVNPTIIRSLSFLMPSTSVCASRTIFIIFINFFVIPRSSECCAVTPQQTPEIFLCLCLLFFIRFLRNNKRIYIIRFPYFSLHLSIHTKKGIDPIVG